MTMSDTYPMPLHGWTCFFCGENFMTEGAARDHFGADPDQKPGCLEKVRPGEERGLLMVLRDAQDENAGLRKQIAELEYDAASYHDAVFELQRRFGGARTVREAWNRFDAMEGRALVAEEMERIGQGRLRNA